MSYEEAFEHAVVLHRAGQLAEAEAAYRALLREDESRSECGNNLGLLVFARGDAAEAEALYRQAIASYPDNTDAHTNLGGLLAARGDIDDAIESFHAALRIDPSSVSARVNLATHLTAWGRYDEAARQCLQAITTQPLLPEAHNQMGNIMLALDDYPAALVWFRRAAAIAPDWGPAYNNIGATLRRAGHLEAAAAHFYHAMRAADDFVDAYLNYGNVLTDLGRPQDAVTSYDRVLAVRPDHAGALHNIPFALNYADDISAEDLARRHFESGSRLEAPFLGPVRHGVPQPLAGRRLRIGYVSPDFRAHAVAFFFEPLLAAHDRAKVEIFCYAELTAPDAVSERIAKSADHWRPTRGMSDDALADRIAADRIDVLVDLAGHSAHNRLLVLARRPAPVQVTWLGYANTTGLTTIDARLVDAISDPAPQANGLASERLIRLEGGFHCYLPPEDAPSVKPPPSLEQGHVTFGTFNNIAKISPSTLRVWSRILERLPTSRLYVKSRFFSDPESRARSLQRLVEHGIPETRVTLAEGIPTIADHLDAYGRIDIALDSFPYNGTTTLCEAMWMGVPVVTLRGDRHAARVGASLLTHVGLTELIAESEQDYVERAVALARDPVRLTALRQELRARMAASSLCDPPAFAHKIETAFFALCEERFPKAATQIANPDALVAEGLRRLQAGDRQSAAEFYRAALDFHPDSPDLLQSAAVAFYLAGRLEDAIAHFQRAVERAPTNPQAHAHLGMALNDSGRTREGIAALQRAIVLDPAESAAHTNLGCSLRALGRIEEALACFLRGVTLEPTAPEIHSNLGTALTTLDRPAEGGLRFYTSIVLSPAYADAYSNLGAVMLRGGLPHSEPAMKVLLRAVQVNPDLPTAHSNLSVILANRGDPDSAVPHNLRAAEVAPNPEHWSRVLFNLNYCDSWSAADCANEHKRIGALFDAAGEVGRLPPPLPRREGRHRIGFVSPDFRNHSVAYFLKPLLAAIDRTRFEIFCYSDLLKGDDVTAEIRARADHWVDAFGLTDAELARKVRADQIDTLIDLAGHTPANRMGAFALRPAPVQMTWLGYANTSGLSTIDYRIVDEITDPPGTADALASETLLRLPGGFLCYGPPPYAPEPAARPPAEDGAVIFGTFNNPTKITDATFDLWSRLLNRLPRAKLLIKSFRLRDEVLRQHIVGKFLKNGVAGERLILLDANADAVEHLATYGQIDIGLDPVLYNGTTTTFEALWMGVPVIAERGDRHAGRVGASLLTHIGLPELIAENAEDYVETACRLAENPAELARLRTGLRQRLAASPLCDAIGYARKFEASLLRTAGHRATAPGKFDKLKTALGRAPLDLAAIEVARDALADAVRADLAAIPSIEALAPLCRDLTLLGLRQIGAMPPAGRGLGEVLAHCLTAPAYSLRALPELDTLPPGVLATVAALLLEEPVFWTAPREPERYATHVEAVLTLARKGLTAQAHDPAAAQAALLVAAACRLGPAMTSALPMTGAARERAALIELWLSGQGVPLDHDFATPKRRRKRLGVFRTHWDSSGDSAVLLSHLEDLKAQGEVTVYAIHPLGESAVERSARSLADKITLLPDSIAEAATALRQDDLDLLLIGHDLTTQLSLPAALAAYRLARRQAVTAASPAEPGFIRLDDWLGEVPMPPREWIPEGPLPVSLSRAELGVPDDRLLLVSAAPLIKLTAEVLACWGTLLKKCLDAHLLLFPFDQGWTGHPALAGAADRLRALLDIEPADQARVTLLPPGVSKAGARAVLAVSDLFLDAFPSSDPADLLDPLAVGLPMLLSRGKQARHRRIGEIHRLYDLPALVADGPQEYERMALSLAASPAERMALGDKAAACRKRLDERGTLISWLSFPSRVATSDSRSDRNLDI